MFLHNKDIDLRQIIHFISNDIQLDPLTFGENHGKSPGY